MSTFKSVIYRLIIFPPYVATLSASKEPSGCFISRPSLLHPPICLIIPAFGTNDFCLWQRRRIWIFMLNYHWLIRLHLLCPSMRTHIIFCHRLLVATFWAQLHQGIRLSLSSQHATTMWTEFQSSITPSLLLLGIAFLKTQCTLPLLYVHFLSV